ncbi:2-C-methyl-D-erythritol 4-phosphate cytidylyltransferase [Neobacillus sp. OS1-32]|jgi:2-C-methyl-D-erythritol 4-phosphate cytidylyltransferase|uniref:2-C-methyl-D-erythritol 4-phosphate cytidylyltransferase n=1 Tax=Neobacillus paridis TaxID=2803862 RepID=A0ABS1TIV0_9BACI|nr:MULTISPECIES: 2-C-methyl-D-erythritol 4-phosphate cytidylyltransferase [Neobacillus]MBL4950959.1 2-C-methyl-D-erythritol 4-phosphate cytidylyltransferase [Neobacillus paridis]WML29452.1 2-C-methyl-D-erythritol 4-phosphate cytidylyltransferase [Neobacillus sp. OS1-32]
MTYQVIIPAAGQGKRMGAGKNKLLLELDGIPVLIHTLRVFEADDACAGIILAVHPQDESEIKALIEQYQLTKVCGFAPGGKERQDSIFNALKTVETDGIILVHDGARPFIQIEQIQLLTELAAKTGAAIIAVPAKDTMKKVKNGVVEATVDRSSLWAVQTPQAFRVSLLKEAYEKADKECFIGTDDASLVERLGQCVAIVEGDYDNIKLTTMEDLYFAEAILKKRKKEFK